MKQETVQRSSPSTKGGPADPLRDPILTKTVWDEIHNIFKIHFSTEMPFLHPPTFRILMRQGDLPLDLPISPTSNRHNRELLLLGILTLTARFHRELVAYHTQSLGQEHCPLAASEYYATKLAWAFEPSRGYLTNPSLESIQALLLLGYYEWSQGRGVEAWVYIGMAIRLAQAVGLECEGGIDDCTFHSSSGRERSNPEADDRESFIIEESRRRTLWSCLMMDRMLAAGKDRPMMIRVEKLRVGLPRWDDQFFFARKGQIYSLNRGGFGEDGPTQAENAVVNEGVLGRYIRLVEIFGRLCEWSYAGGRRTEKLPPWNKSTEFSRLRQHLEDFRTTLPPNLILMESNLSAYMGKRDATPYISMHTLHSLCLIMLHREYIPFLPLQCRRPEGPLDEPTFPKENFGTPVGFWEQSAEIMFKAARDLLDLIRICWDNNSLPETPLIRFAIWQAAYLCVYAAQFPHMDTRCQLLGLHEMNQPNGEASGCFPVNILSRLASRSKMADGYIQTFWKIRAYFQGINQFPGTPLRFSNGLEQYKLVERELRDFGRIHPGEDIIPSRLTPLIL
jgi:hypothetical protein